MNRTNLLAAAFLPVVLFAHASPSESDVDAARITEILQSRYPEVKVEQVSSAQRLPGLYEVVTAGEIVYTDINADLLIAGTITDTRTRENLTAKRWGELHTIDFGALPLDLAIRTVRGKGTRQLAVFSDPDCPYCRKLEQELQNIDDVTVYTFLMPLQDIHPKAREKAAKIWCAQDRAGAWTDWMVKGAQPTGESCGETPIAQVLKLSEQFGIEATPTLFLADGRRMEGALGREQLERELGTVKSGK